MIARCDPDLTAAFLAASADVRGSLDRQLGGASKSIVSWALIALGVVFWELEFPAVCFVFEQGEPLFSPASEVFGSGVAKVHDRGDERLIVRDGWVEFSHGVVMDKRFAIAAASYGVSGSAKADLVS